MKRILVFLLSFSGVNAQELITLNDALMLCNRDSNLYLRIEGFKMDVAKADVAAASATGNVKYNNQTIHLSSPSYFIPGTTYLNRYNMQTLHQVTKNMPWPSHFVAKKDFAKENYFLSTLEYNRFEYTFKKKVTEAWLSAWLDEKRTAIYSKHYNSLDSMTRLMKEKKNFSATDFERISILQEEYLLKMNKLRVLFFNQVRHLKMMLSIEATPDFSTLNWLETYTIPLLTYDSLRKLVNANRPELVVLDENEKVAEKELRMNKTSVWEDPEIGILINPQNTLPYLGSYFTITLPSFDLKKGAVARSKIRMKEAESLKTLAEKELYTEAMNILDLYTVNFVDLQLAYNYRVNATSDVKKTRSEFLEKKTDLLTLLESEREYFQTEISYFEALYDFFKSKSELLFATGLVKDVIK